MELEISTRLLAMSAYRNRREVFGLYTDKQDCLSLNLGQIERVIRTWLSWLKATYKNEKTISLDLFLSPSIKIQNDLYSSRPLNHMAQQTAMIEQYDYIRRNSGMTEWNTQLILMEMALWFRSEEYKHNGINWPNIGVFHFQRKEGMFLITPVEEFWKFDSSIITS